jgi:hypothetical protein
LRQPAASDRKKRQNPVETEACAQRLHAIAGAMLLHYAIYRRLPDSLDGLRGLADVDQELNFTCPVSGQPYAYNPAGLEYQGREERLIVYDALPAHGGTRWGILASPPHGTRPAATWAVQLPEGVFRLYEAPPQIPAVPPADEPPAKPDTAPPSGQER